MNLALIKKWITRWESTRFAAYDDKTGKPITPTTVLVGKAHIGVGFDLEAPGAQAIVTGLHLDYAGIKAGRVVITADQVDELLDTTVAMAVTGAKNLVPNFDDLPADKQLVLVDLRRGEDLAERSPGRGIVYGPNRNRRHHEVPRLLHRRPVAGR